MPDDHSWTWKNFTIAEITCKCGCGQTCIDRESMDALQTLREKWGAPIIINSAHRCPAHNRRVGGRPKSYHLQLAFDCRCPEGDQAAFARLAKESGFTGIIQYRGRGFVHLDCRPAPYEKVAM